MHEVMRQASPEAGVVALLKHLRVHICHEPRSDFRRVLPVYERLLSPREDANISVQKELLEIRAKLLTCGEDADVIDVVDRMDQVVERCMEIQEQQNRQQSSDTAVPVEEVMRLLVALAGGEDGETFILEDHMRTTNEKSTMFSDAGKKRIGDRIRVNDVVLLQRSKALFDKAPVPLEESRLFSPDLFNALGNGLPRQHSGLWCPDTDVATAEDRGFLNMVLFSQPNRFIDLPGGSPLRSGVDRSLQINGAPKRQCSRVDVNKFKAMKPQERGSGLSSSKDVFFYDATREVHCGGWKQSTDWGETSSITENSSWGSESSFDGTDPWIAQTYAWEDLGNRVGLPAGYCRPSVREDKRSLRDLVVPAAFAFRNYAGGTPLEIHEEDLIEDSLRALNGVDSAIFRRDFQTATFKLPEKRSLKLRNTTSTVTASVLEVFRKAGTIVMRLDLLSIYYSQDPARGGKTLQAMGDALQLYLSMHQTLVKSIAQECLKSTLGKTDQEDEKVVSVTKLVCKTRTVCRVLETVVHIFGCAESTEFWPLLQQGKFPRGVTLLDRLYGHVLSLRVEDTTGHMQELVTWFLVKSCSPMLAVLSDLIASGRVQESTDPFGEFEVTTWSRNLLEKATAGGGDGVFSKELSMQATDMLPEFLREISPLIIHLSQVQALLRSVDAMSSTHPLVNMQSLTMIIRGHEAVEHAEDWQAKVTEAMAPIEKCQHPDTEIDTNVLMGALRTTGSEVLNEPGGIGTEIYGILYGGPSGMPKPPQKISITKPGGGPASGTVGIDMADSSSGVNQSGPTDDATPSETPPPAFESEDIEMQDSTHDQEETQNSYSGSPSAETRGSVEPTGSSRVSLPSVHPFFSWEVPEDDCEVLTRALTETLAEADLTSFASIVDCCVQVPVRLVAHKLEDVAVNWFRNAVQIVEHLRWLRKLMLMSEGLCMDIFARDFLLGLNSDTRVNWGVERRLSSALTLAMIEGSMAVDPIARNFHYKTTSTLSQVLDSLTMIPSVPNILSEIELVYDVAWPLGLVITSQSLLHYQQMHRFLLYVRLTSLEMREAWGMLRALRRQRKLSSALERLTGGVIFKMQALLRAFNETFATKFGARLEVLMTAWSELEHASQMATTLAELRRCHEEYVGIAIRCCFLDTLVFSIHSAFLNTLAASWSLTTFVRGLERQVTGRASEESRIRALCEDCDVALWALVASLQSVNHDAQRSTREFSESLLLRLNFNHYYTSRTSPLNCSTSK